MPVTVRKTDGKYSVSTPNQVHAKGTTKKKAMAQANLLRAVEHGWHPTGQPAKKGKEKKKHSKMSRLLSPGMRMKS